MGTIYYYIPGIQTVKNKKLIEHGLEYIIPRKGDPDQTEMIKGPDTGSGVLFAYQDTNGKTRLHQNADKLKWQRKPKSNVWIGLFEDDMPAPKDLERDPLMGVSYEIELANNIKWKVPIIRALDGNATLPRKMKHDGESWIPDKQPSDEKHCDLFNRTCKAFDQINLIIKRAEENTEADDSDDDNGIEFTITDGYELAADAMMLNYRIGPTEMSLLEMFDTDSQEKILYVLIDWIALLEIKKK